MNSPSTDRAAHFTVQGLYRDDQPSLSGAPVSQWRLFCPHLRDATCISILGAHVYTYTYTHMHRSSQPTPNIVVLVEHNLLSFALDNTDLFSLRHCERSSRSRSARRLPSLPSLVLLLRRRDILARFALLDALLPCLLVIGSAGALLGSRSAHAGEGVVVSRPGVVRLHSRILVPVGARSSRSIFGRVLLSAHT